MIWEMLKRICMEEWVEEEFEELWWEFGEFGFGIVRYKNGVVRFEIYSKGRVFSL